MNTNEQENKNTQLNTTRWKTVAGAIAIAASVGGYAGAGVASRDLDVRGTSTSVSVAMNPGIAELIDRNGDGTFDMRIEHERMYTPNPYCGEVTRYLIDRDVQTKLERKMNLLVDQCTTLEWTDSSDKRLKLTINYNR